MQRIFFICDNCRKIAGVQDVMRDYEVRTYLRPMGKREEWCDNCIDIFEKERSANIKNNNSTMDSTKTIADIIAELQALDTTQLDAVVAGVSQAVTDLQAVASATPTSPAAPTATSVTITFSDNSTQTLPTANA